MSEPEQEQPPAPVFPWWIFTIVGMLLSIGAMLISQQAVRQSLQINQQIHRPVGR